MTSEQSVSLDSSVRPVRRSMSAELGSSWVVLKPSEGVYYGFEDVAATIWDLLQRPCKVRSILESVLEEYDVEREKCQADLLEFLTDLKGRDLIELVD